MKPMSESLSDLAARVQRLEESAAAVRETNRANRQESVAKLEQRRHEMEDTFEQTEQEFKAGFEQVNDRVGQFWTDLRAPVKRRIEATRADHEARKAEREVEKAKWLADEAEENAAITIAIAADWVDAAEYAVVQAALARAESDSMADVAQGG